MIGNSGLKDNFFDYKKVWFKLVAITLAGIFLFNDISYSLQATSRLAPSVGYEDPSEAIADFQTQTLTAFLNLKIREFLHEPKNRALSPEGYKTYITIYLRDALKDNIDIDTSGFIWDGLDVRDGCVLIPRRVKDGTITILKFTIDEDNREHLLTIRFPLLESGPGLAPPIVLENLDPEGPAQITLQPVKMINEIGLEAYKVKVPGYKTDPLNKRFNVGIVVNHRKSELQIRVMDLGEDPPAGVGLTICNWASHRAKTLGYWLTVYETYNPRMLSLFAKVTDYKIWKKLLERGFWICAVDHKPKVNYDSVEEKYDIDTSGGAKIEIEEDEVVASNWEGLPKGTLLEDLDILQDCRIVLRPTGEVVGRLMRLPYYMEVMANPKPIHGDAEDLSIIETPLKGKKSQYKRILYLSARELGWPYKQVGNSVIEEAQALVRLRRTFPDAKIEALVYYPRLFEDMFSSDGNMEFFHREKDLVDWERLDDEEGPRWDLVIDRSKYLTPFIERFLKGYAYELLQINFGFPVMLDTFRDREGRTFEIKDDSLTSEVTPSFIYEAFSRKLNAIGLEGGETVVPELKSSQKIKTLVEKDIQKALGSRPPKPIILINPHSDIAGPWPIENWVTLIERIAKTQDVHVVISHGGNEYEETAYQNIVRQITDPNVKDKIIELPTYDYDLASFFALLSYAKLCITINSAPLHLAAVLRVPTIVLSDSSSHGWTPPVNGIFEIAKEKTNEITIDQVIDKVNEALGRDSSLTPPTKVIKKDLKGSVFDIVERKKRSEEELAALETRRDIATAGSLSIDVADIDARAHTKEAVIARAKDTPYLAVCYLSTCVGCVLYDEKAKVGSILHLDVSTDVTRALDEAIEDMTNLGADRSNLKAWVLGGKGTIQSKSLLLDVIEFLNKEKIKIQGMDILDPIFVKNAILDLESGEIFRVTAQNGVDFDLLTTVATGSLHIFDELPASFISQLRLNIQRITETQDITLKSWMNAAIMDEIYNLWQRIYFCEATMGGTIGAVVAREKIIAETIEKLKKIAEAKNKPQGPAIGGGPNLAKILLWTIGIGTAMALAAPARSSAKEIGQKVAETAVQTIQNSSSLGWGEIAMIIPALLLLALIVYATTLLFGRYKKGIGDTSLSEGRTVSSILGLGRKEYTEPELEQLADEIRKSEITIKETLRILVNSRYSDIIKKVLEERIVSAASFDEVKFILGSRESLLEPVLKRLEILALTGDAQDKRNAINEIIEISGQSREASIFEYLNLNRLCTAAEIPQPLRAKLQIRLLKIALWSGRPVVSFEAEKVLLNIGFNKMEFETLVAFSEFDVFSEDAPPTRFKTPEYKYSFESELEHGIDRLTSVQIRDLPKRIKDTFAANITKRLEHLILTENDEEAVDGLIAFSWAYPAISFETIGRLSIDNRLKVSLRNKLQQRIIAIHMHGNELQKSILRDNEALVNYERFELKNLVFAIDNGVKSSRIKTALLEKFKNLSLEDIINLDKTMRLRLKADIVRRLYVFIIKGKQGALEEFLNFSEEAGRYAARYLSDILTRFSTDINKTHAILKRLIELNFLAKTDEDCAAFGKVIEAYGVSNIPLELLLYAIRDERFKGPEQKKYINALGQKFHPIEIKEVLEEMRSITKILELAKILDVIARKISVGPASVCLLQFAQSDNPEERLASLEPLYIVFQRTRLLGKEVAETIQKPIEIQLVHFLVNDPNEEVRLKAREIFKHLKLSYLTLETLLYLYSEIDKVSELAPSAAVELEIRFSRFNNIDELVRLIKTHIQRHKKGINIPMRRLAALAAKGDGKAVLELRGLIDDEKIALSDKVSIIQPLSLSLRRSTAELIGKVVKELRFASKAKTLSRAAVHDLEEALLNERIHIIIRTKLLGYFVRNKAIILEKRELFRNLLAHAPPRILAKEEIFFYFTLIRILELFKDPDTLPQLSQLEQKSQDITLKRRLERSITIISGAGGREQPRREGAILVNFSLAVIMGALLVLSRSDALLTSAAIIATAAVTLIAAKRWLEWVWENNSFSRDKFLPFHLNILEDFLKKPFAYIFALMKRDNSGSAVSMAEVDMASSLTDSDKIQISKDPNYNGGFERDEMVTHLATSISWRPINLSEGTVGRSTSRHKLIASLIRFNNTGKVLAWVWHPFKAGTEAIRVLSSSFSIITKNWRLRIRGLLSQLNYTAGSRKSQSIGNNLCFAGGPLMIALAMLSWRDVFTRSGSGMEKIRLKDLKIIRELGEGGESIIHLAKDKDGNKYTLRTIRGYEGTKENDKRLKELVQILKEINPDGKRNDLPYLVNVDFNDEKKPVFIYRYNVGERLTLFRDSPDDLASLPQILLSLANTLGHVHKAGVIHCDVKPDNVLVTDAKEAILIDFGCAAIRKKAGERVIRGTQFYISPQQGDKGHPQPIDDIFSFGVTIYEMLLKKEHREVRSFTKDIPSNFVGRRGWRKMVEERTIDSPLRPIMLKCLQFNPKKRYQNAEELAKALERLVKRETGRDSGLTPKRDGFVRQGEKSWRIFQERVDEYRKNDITDQYRDRMIKLLENLLKVGTGSLQGQNGKIEPVPAFLFSLSEDERAKIGNMLTKLKKYKIYGFESIVEAPNDFVFDWNNADVEEPELFLATDVIEELQNHGPPGIGDVLSRAALKTGGSSSSLLDEYLLHTILCSALGHKEAIKLQQKLFENHYENTTDDPELVGEYQVKDGIKYKVDRKGKITDNLLKGLLGNELRRIINWKATEFVQAEITDLDIALRVHNEAWLERADNEHLKLTPELMKNLIEKKLIYLLKIKGVNNPVRGVLCTYRLRTEGNLSKIHKRPLWDNMIHARLEDKNPDTVLFWAIGSILRKDASQEINLGRIFIQKAKAHLQGDGFKYKATFSPISEKDFSVFRRILEKKKFGEELIKKFGIYLYLLSFRKGGYEEFIEEIYKRPKPVSLEEIFLERHGKKLRDDVANFHVAKGGARIAKVLSQKEGYTRPDGLYTAMYAYEGFKEDKRIFKRLQGFLERLKQLGMPPVTGLPTRYLVQQAIKELQEEQKLTESPPKEKIQEMIEKLDPYLHEFSDDELIKYIKRYILGEEIDLSKLIIPEGPKKKEEPEAVSTVDITTVFKKSFVEKTAGPARRIVVNIQDNVPERVILNMKSTFFDEILEQLEKDIKGDEVSNITLNVRIENEQLVLELQDNNGTLNFNGLKKLLKERAARKEVIDWGDGSVVLTDSKRCIKRLIREEINCRLMGAAEVSDDIKAPSRLRIPINKYGQDCQALIDALILAKDAKKAEGKIIIGLDTSWIPAKDGLQELISAINKLSEPLGMGNIIIVRGEGENLADEIGRKIDEYREKGIEILHSNIVVLGSKDTITAEGFKRFNPFFIEVNPEELKKEVLTGKCNFIMLVKMLEMALKVAFLDRETESIDIPGLKGKRVSPRVWLFIPGAIPINIEEASQIYKLQASLIDSAA